MMLTMMVPAMASTKYQGFQLICSVFVSIGATPPVPPLGTIDINFMANAPITEPMALLRQLAQTRPQIAIIRPTRTIPHALAIRPGDSVRPSLAHLQRRLGTRDSFPLCGGRYH